MKNIIKKADIVLFIILVVLGLFLTWFAVAGRSGGAQVVIHVEGKIYGTYSLSRNQTIDIDEYGHHNIVVIEDGKVQMMESSCHNQVCVKQGAVNTTNVPIICLPNRVVVEIIDESGEEEYDVISR